MVHAELWHGMTNSTEGSMRHHTTGRGIFRKLTDVVEAARLSSCNSSAQSRGDMSQHLHCQYSQDLVEEAINTELYRLRPQTDPPLLWIPRPSS
jgi:hypothetical protein